MVKLRIVCYILNVVVLTTGTHHYYWRDYSGVLPLDGISFVGIYVSQIPYYYSMLPAAFYPEKEEAHTEAFGARRIVKDGIKILCDLNSENFYWEYTTTEKLTKDRLSNLVVGGLESNSTLYIGKAFHEGEWKIGKVFPVDSEYKGFKTWNNTDGSFRTLDDFQVLKYKEHPITPRC